MTADLLLRYHASSSASDDAARLAVASPDQTPVFFDGYAEHSEQTAQALLCIARVARTRFSTPPAMLAARLAAADPVVTTASDRLRFEAFSACGGVHARLDLLDDGLDVRRYAPGTTNVDVNPPMREALARIARREPLRIVVGEASVAVETLDASIVERRVPLPERWIRGFGEVQVALSGSACLLELGKTEAQRFVRGLPRGSAGDAPAWAEPTAAGVHVATRWRPGAVCLAAPSRLRILEPLVRFATGLMAYGDPDATQPSAVAWVLTLDGARLCVTLSPERTRGFSGEGGLLFDLISERAAADAGSLGAAVAGRERFTLDEVAEAARLPRDRATAGMTWLGLHGHLGFDPVDRCYFHRRLPYPADVLAVDPPRLRDARVLADAGAVAFRPDGTARVVSGGREYRAAVDGAGFRCSCPWIATHGTARGPCKHVLAVAILRLGSGPCPARSASPGGEISETVRLPPVDTTGG